MKIKNFEELDEIQKEIVKYLADFIVNNGWTPSLTMIYQAMEKFRGQRGITIGFSTHWVIYQLQNIEKIGSIVLEKSTNPEAKMKTVRRRIRPIKIKFLDKIKIEEDEDKEDRQDIFDELRGLLKEHSQFPDMWDTDERLKEWLKEKGEL